MRVPQTRTTTFLLELGLLSAEEEDAHHVPRVRDDALLHEVVGAFQGRLDSAVLIRLLGARRRGALQHG